MSDPNLCPRCLQGVVITRTVKQTGEKILICDECEALWPPDARRDSHNFIEFHAFMKIQGLAALWSELESEANCS
jgi:hypothetical protein